MQGEHQGYTDPRQSLAGERPAAERGIPAAQPISGLFLCPPYTRPLATPVKKTALTMTPLAVAILG